jgi:DNA-binding Lrp family transcriptional regulator
LRNRIVAADSLKNVPRSPPTPEHIRERDLGRRSMAFLLDQILNGVAGLSHLDALLVLAINQANIAPLTREPLARIRYGSLKAPAPDARRRAVSVNAVAQSLGVPFETVRRRVRALTARGVTATGEHGLIVPEAFLGSPEYVQTVTAGHWRLLAFFREVRAAGWTEELPRSAYPPEDSVPIRAAARLLADYVLRTAANLLPLAGGVSPTVVLLGIVAAGPNGTTPTQLAQRLAMPAETVRRHAHRLAERRACARRETSFVADDASLSGSGWPALLHENAADVQRLFAGLAERGVVEAWSRLAPPRAADGAMQAGT